MEKRYTYLKNVVAQAVSDSSVSARQNHKIERALKALENGK